VQHLLLKHNPINYNIMQKLILGAIASTLTIGSSFGVIALQVDFNSTNQDGGPHPQAGWSSYDAGHEVAADFVTQNYGGISVTPAWPNTTDNRVQQMIDRGAGNDNQWDNASGDLDLVTDFLGTDTRGGNGGNGNWDGTTGTPTYMTLSITGLNAGQDYTWTSLHHDTENVHGAFAAWGSPDGGTNWGPLADGVMTDSSTGGNPDSGAALESGPDAFSLPSAYTFTFTATGDDAIRFAPYAGGAVHSQIWGINGFRLETIPEPSSAILLVGGLGGMFLRRRR
jgi:hypothetical protein